MARPAFAIAAAPPRQSPWQSMHAWQTCSRGKLSMPRKRVHIADMRILNNAAQPFAAAAAAVGYSKVLFVQV